MPGHGFRFTGSTVKSDLGPQQLRVLRLLKAGLTQYAAAQTLGISRQRVSEIVQRLRELGELPEEKAS
jgi:transcriptional regulator